jgi:hypothetical protein
MFCLMFIVRQYHGPSNMNKEHNHLQSFQFRRFDKWPKGNGQEALRFYVIFLFSGVVAEGIHLKSLCSLTQDSRMRASQLRIHS